MTNTKKILKNTISGLLLVAVGACGGGGAGDSNSAPTAAPAPSPTAAPAPAPTAAGLYLLAGHIGDTGSADGVGAAARFSFPNAIAADAAGNIYVVDADVRRVYPSGAVPAVSVTPAIRKITPTGAVTTLTQLSTDFTGDTELTVDHAGNVYLLKTSSGVIEKITPNGVVTPLNPAYICAYYCSITVDAVGTLYVGSSKGITKVSLDGAVSLFAGGNFNQYADGVGAAASFGYISGLATDQTGNVYVSDDNTIRKVTVDGTVTTLAGLAGFDNAGSADGIGSEARFQNPGGIALDSANNVYVVDRGNKAIRKITQAGVVTTIASNVAGVGVPVGALFDTPNVINGLAVYVTNGLAVSGNKLYITTANAVLWMPLP